MFRHISLINCDKTFVVLKKAEKPLAPLVLAGENLEIVMFEIEITGLRSRPCDICHFLA